MNLHALLRDLDKLDLELVLTVCDENRIRVRTANVPGFTYPHQAQASRGGIDGEACSAKRPRWAVMDALRCLAVAEDERRAEAQEA